MSRVEGQLLEKGMVKKEDEEKPAWIHKLEELVAGLWLCQEEEEANADSTVETEVPTLQRSMGAKAPGHQEVQPGAVELQLEQFEKKLEQLEDQLEEHAQDAAVHGEVEKVKETGGGGQAPAAVHKGQVG